MKESSPAVMLTECLLLGLLGVAIALVCLAVHLLGAAR